VCKSNNESALETPKLSIELDSILDHSPCQNQVVTRLYRNWNQDALGCEELHYPVIKGFSNTGGTDQLEKDVIRKVVGIVTTALEKPNEPLLSGFISKPDRYI